eukprot:768672-Hanusia_phi.AAC.10
MVRRRYRSSRQRGRGRRKLWLYATSSWWRGTKSTPSSDPDSSNFKVDGELAHEEKEEGSVSMPYPHTKLFVPRSLVMFCWTTGQQDARQK